MKIIAHRGNIHGPSASTENSIEAIDKCIRMGLDVEIDLWVINDEFFLGHDSPVYEISFRWLRDRLSNIWIHCKNLEAFNLLSNTAYEYKFFYHQNDDFTLTSSKHIWTYPKNEVASNSIIVDADGTDDWERIKNCYGVCTDYALVYVEKELEKKYRDYVYNCACVEEHAITYSEFKNQLATKCEICIVHPTASCGCIK